MVTLSIEFWKYRVTKGGYSENYENTKGGYSEFLIGGHINVTGQL